MKHVLLCRLDNDGDVLMAGPAVRAVAAHADRVTLICGPRGKAAAHLLPGVDDVLVFRAPWIDADGPPVDKAALEALVARIRARCMDEGFVLTSFHQCPLPMALLLRLADVRTLAAISEEYPGGLLDVRHRGLDESLHEVQRSLSLVATLGYALPPGDDDRLRLNLTLPERGGDYLVVHPGCSVPARAWAVEKNAELVDALAAQGHRVVVTGGPGEVEMCARVAGKHGENRAGQTQLPDLARLIAGAGAIVVGNTGPAHLAAAVGTPVVSIFPPTVPAHRWRPWRVPQVLLGNQSVPCAGCRARVCPVPGQPCLADVTVQHVLDAVEYLLQGGQTKCKSSTWEQSLSPAELPAWAPPL